MRSYYWARNSPLQLLRVVPVTIVAKTWYLVRRWTSGWALLATFCRYRWMKAIFLRRGKIVTRACAPGVRRFPGGCLRV